MGSYDFIAASSGGDVEQAFLNAKAEAAWEYGHRPYTGTIAEKDEYVLVADRPMTTTEA